MIQHLPALQIALPLIGAPIAVILRNTKLAYAWTLAVTWAVFGIAASLLQRTLEEGPFRYDMGGWLPPFGISLRIDPVSAFVLLIVGGIGALVMTYAYKSMTAEIPKAQQTFFLAAYLLAMTGMLGMTATGDAFNVFVFLEISSLASYILISLGRSRRALTAAYQYLIMGAIGGTFILIGIGMMYMMTGTLDMADLANKLSSEVMVNGQMVPVDRTRTILVSFAFITVGTGLKLALWPMHIWLPNAYTYAPSVVSAFISATSTKVMVYVFIRFIFSVFGVTFAFETLSLGMPLLILSLVGIYVASTAAIFQSNLKRLLAYSSVAQIGYMILGISLATVGGLSAGILHLFNHALIKAGMFMAVGHIALRTGTVRLEDLSGVGRKMPWTFMAFVLGGLGLIGVPLTVGFVSKWVLLSAIADTGQWWVAALALLSSLLAVAYVWRFVEVAWLREPSEAMKDVKEAPLSLLIPTYVVIGASLFFGAYGTFTTDVATRAAKMLMGVMG